MSQSRPRPPVWLIVALLFIGLFDVWWRGHTFAPGLKARFGFAPYPVVAGQTEPLDCDEALYAYIGQTLVQGGALYRDVSENKPPLGYLFYAAAVELGGYEELAIRVLPIPFVLGTLFLVGWVGFRVGGPGVGCLAAFLFSIASTDPYIYGNTAQLEHFMNLGSTAALAFLVEGFPRRQWPWLFAAGLSLGAASMVKQVAALPMGLAAVTLLFTRSESDERTLLNRILNLTALSAGWCAVLLVTLIYLQASGAGGWAYDDIVRFGRALATDTLPDPSAPSPLVRWLTGNADPTGELPPPFGKTDYLVWWGRGSFPFLLTCMFSALGLGIMPVGPMRRFLVAWYAAMWGQVILPGLYWPHYYLLTIPAGSVMVAVFLGDLGRKEGTVVALPPRIRDGLQLILGLLLATFVTIQARDYLFERQQALTEKYKGGRQWVFLRELGRELERRSKLWNEPSLLIWGWQSPLLFYSHIDAPSRHAFANNLIRDHANSDHPLVRPRIEELMEDLRRDPPELISTGYAPFPELRAFLRSEYFPSRLSINTPDDRGLWVRKDVWADFETYAITTEVGRKSRPDRQIKLRIHSVN